MSAASVFDGKVIWLTGASSGIGRALAQSLSAYSCTLLLSARGREALDELADSLQPNAKAKVFVVPVDVSNESEMRALGESMEAEYGAVDMLIANAGTHTPTTLDSFSVEHVASLFEVNFFGALRCVETVLEQMKRRRSGQLVFVSSVAGYRGLPHAAAYGASKAALTHFAESIRFDASLYDISVTVVSPGFVKTPLTDKNEFEMPFIIEAQEAARYIVDGLEKKKLEVAFPPLFVWILKCLRVLPHRLYYSLIRSKVMKPE